MREQRYNIRPQDFGDILFGYSTAMIAVNVAVRARSDGEAVTQTYLARFDDHNGQRTYLSSRLRQLKSHIESDFTCADLFDYLIANPPRNSQPLGFGLKLAKLEFGAYGFIIIGSMQRGLGGPRTSMIWRKSGLLMRTG